MRLSILNEIKRLYFKMILLGFLAAVFTNQDFVNTLLSLFNYTLNEFGEPSLSILNMISTSVFIAGMMGIIYDLRIRELDIEDILKRSFLKNFIQDEKLYETANSFLEASSYNVLRKDMELCIEASEKDIDYDKGYVKYHVFQSYELHNSTSKKQYYDVLLHSFVSNNESNEIYSVLIEEMEVYNEQAKIDEDKFFYNIVIDSQSCVRVQIKTILTMRINSSHVFAFNRPTFLSNILINLPKAIESSLYQYTHEQERFYLISNKRKRSKNYEFKKWFLTGQSIQIDFYIDLK